MNRSLQRANSPPNLPKLEPSEPVTPVTSLAPPMSTPVSLVSSPTPALPVTPVSCMNSFNSLNSMSSLTSAPISSQPPKPASPQPHQQSNGGAGGPIRRRVSDKCNLPISAGTHHLSSYDMCYCLIRPWLPTENKRVCKRIIRWRPCTSLLGVSLSKRSCPISTGCWVLKEIELLLVINKAI